VEDEIVLIADDASQDKVEKRTPRGLVLETDSATASRSKLQVEARKALSNNPQKWGEAIAVVNPEQDRFAEMSLDRLEEIARAAELDEIVRAKHKLDLDNDSDLFLHDLTLTQTLAGQRRAFMRSIPPCERSDAVGEGLRAS
jgi:hypothetical protein